MFSIYLHLNIKILLDNVCKISKENSQNILLPHDSHCYATALRHMCLLLSGKIRNWRRLDIILLWFTFVMSYIYYDVTISTPS